MKELISELMVVIIALINIILLSFEIVSPQYYELCFCFVEYAIIAWLVNLIRKMIRYRAANKSNR